MADGFKVFQTLLDIAEIAAHRKKHGGRIHGVHNVVLAGYFEFDINLANRRHQSECCPFDFAGINITVRRSERHDAIVAGHLAPFNRKGIGGIDDGYALTRKLSKDFTVFFGSLF